MEILTEHGWKHFKDVLDGERVATRNECGELEYQHFTDRIVRQHKGPMHQFEGKRLNFSVTPTHRMLVRSRGSQTWRFVNAEDLKPGQVYEIAKTTTVAEREPGVIDVDGERLPVVASRGGRGGSRKDGGWSEEEDARLTEHYPSTPMDSLLAALPGRTRGSVYNRAKKIGLTRGQIGDRHGDKPKPLPPVSRELFAYFLGFWLAEGRKYHSGTHRGYGVKLHQSKPEGIAWFDNLLMRMGWPCAKRELARETTWEIKSHGLREYLKALCTETHELHVPDEVFTEWAADEITALIFGMCMGDGSFSEKEQRFDAYTSSSRRLMDDVQRLMVHVGMTGQIRRSTAGGTPTNFPGYAAKHDQWRIGFDVGEITQIKGSQIERVEYDGPVYCLTVPNGTLMVRREGVAMWAGNCVAINTARLLGEQMKMYLASDLRNQRPHMSQQGGHDALDRFSPDMSNPFAAELGSMAGRGGLARGMRAGTTPRAGRMPSGRSGGGLAGMRRHRS